jgi:CheY-like chemotaxis protein
VPGDREEAGDRRAVHAEEARGLRRRSRATRPFSASTTSPGVILLDLMMPEMDGFEVVAEVRRHEAWRAIPIVVVTAKELTSFNCSTNAEAGGSERR